MMLLKDWRRGRGWSLARLAEELALSGRSPSETVRRWETGESRPDADVVDRIGLLTDGVVTPNDMHEARLRHLLGRSADLEVQ